MKREQLIAELRELGIRPSRERGQNFLLDESVLAQIMAASPPDAQAPALEIGPGLGALSGLLAERCAELTMIELEAAFAARLQNMYAAAPQVCVIHSDALAFDYQSWSHTRPGYQLYGNIPYNITTPLLRKLLLHGGKWSKLTLLLQKQAALRLSRGRGRENGPLTLLVDYYAETQLCFTVPPQAFYPAPAVESALLLLIRRSTPPITPPIDRLLPLMEAAFAERRKLLVNSLPVYAQSLDKQSCRELLTDCGLDPLSRPEELGLSDFARLYQALSERSYL